MEELLDDKEVRGLRKREEEGRGKGREREGKVELTTGWVASTAATGAVSSATTAGAAVYRERVDACKKKKKRRRGKGR